jgi:hypothetical protein
MAATRNGKPTRTGNVAIQPAQAPIYFPVAPTTETIGTNMAAMATQTSAATVPSTLTTSPIVMITTGLASVSSATTTANLPPNVSTMGSVMVAPTVRAPSGTSKAPTTARQVTVLTPIIALTGKATPVTASPVVFRPKPTPVRLLTQNDMVEETLSLDTHTFVNGQPVLDISNLRGEIISVIDFRSIYSPSIYRGSTNFGNYFDDLYQTSLVRDTLRKYLLLNRTATTPQFNSTLNSISLRVNEDITQSKKTISTLDGLIQKIKEINNVLDLKNNMDSVYAFTSPYLGLRNFVTQRMLFSEQSYNIFSDTKVLYQLLFDLGGTLEKCSFNLLSNFTDSDRSAYVSSPVSNRQQKVQDSITLDLTYGDNLTYTPDSIRSKYVKDYVTFNGILNALPASSTDRFKFIVSMLSKEFRVSKGLGKYNLPEAGFFGFQNKGNPFDNVLGGVPSDIFVAPLGNNSLSSLFYLKTSTQNAVVLPFESRQVAGDGETVFVPGTNYFSDGILNGDFSMYNSYREAFSERITKTRSVFNKLLLQQGSFDSTSRNLQPEEMLRSIFKSYVASQDLIRGSNNDSTNILSFVLFSLGNANPKIKFETYKLLLLVALYDTRKTVTQETAQTDRFRDLLLGELAQQKIQGFSETLTESNLPQLLDNQIAVVRQLVLQNIVPLPPEASSKTGVGLSKNQSVSNKQTQQRNQLGKAVPAAPANNRNPDGNVAQVQVQQFANLIYSLRTTSNLFSSVLGMCRQMFSSASTNETCYHLFEGGSITRYHGLTMSGFILLMFEVFSGLVEQFATKNLAYNLAEDNSSRTTKLAATQYIQINFVGNALSQGTADIRNFLRGAACSNTIITDYEAKLTAEDRIIENVLMFFEQLNSRMSNVVAPTAQEATILREIGTNNPNSLSTTRTAKSILAGIVDKKAMYNPNNNRALDFYLPAGKAVSDRNWTAIRRALYQQDFTGNGKLKLATVGIPYGFVKSALGARLNKGEVNNGKLQESTSDLINIKLYRLDKNNDGIIYKPQQYKFDLSLFAKGFDAYPTTRLEAENYYTLRDLFQFYDFDEDLPFDQVTAKTVTEFVASDNYYNASGARRLLGAEVSENLYRSFVLDMYMHITTGLNTSEETFIAYTEAETAQFVSEMEKISLGTADLTKVKFMAPEYRDLLTAFQSNQDDTKLMLTLCNDIRKSVFRQKEYDRVFNILYDINMFPVDVDAMSQTDEGHALLQQLSNGGRLYTMRNETYKKPESLMLDSYFINVELVG